MNSVIFALVKYITRRHQLSFVIEANLFRNFFKVFLSLFVQTAYHLRLISVLDKIWSYNLTIWFFLITALPDELLCVVFKYFSLEEIINKLRLVWRRWRRISESDMLWTNVCLDEWGITQLSEDQFKTIIKHARGFRYFSVDYIDVKKYRFKETQSTGHAICNSLCLSHALNYLNLSG